MRVLFKRVRLVAALCGSAFCAYGQNSRCGVADPAYIRTANESGGIPMFLERSEAAKAFHLVRESTRNNISTVLWATGNLNGSSQTFEIPVDSTTHRITFTLSAGTRGDRLIIKSPAGHVVPEGVRDVEITELNCGRIVTVASPEAGEWLAEITGAGKYWFNAEAQSDIFLISAEFVKRGGRPGHEGLFRIQGQPLAGAPATLRVSLSAPNEFAAFYLVDEHGGTIQPITMRQVSSSSPLEFVGSLDLPTVPFRVAVTGRDSQGRTYLRFSAHQFHAESVEISPRLDFDALPAGSLRQATFVIHNIGAPRTYRVTVTDARRYVTNVEPKELSLGAGESATIRVDLMPPAGTLPGAGSDVIVVASSIGEPNTSNSSVVHVSVSR